jgi:hypothetical protein
MLTAQVMLKGLQKDLRFFFNYVLLFNIFMKITDTFLLNDVKYLSRDILCTEVSHKGKSCSIFLNQHNLIWSKGYIM